MVTTLLWVGIAVFAVLLTGSLMTIAIIGKQKRKERDIHSTSGSVSRHPVLANPILLMYVAFAAIVGLIALFFYWYYGYTDV